jgi:(p)ppGpp synthase/HD superfamily hydrolase
MGSVSQGHPLWPDSIPLGPASQLALTLLTQHLTDKGERERTSAFRHVQRVAETFCQWAGWSEDSSFPSDSDRYIAAILLHHCDKEAKSICQSTFDAPKVISLLQAVDQLNDAAFRKTLGTVLVGPLSLYHAAPIEMAYQYHEMLQALDMRESGEARRTLVDQTWNFHLPLAMRLGLWCAKRQLEDVMLQLADSSSYQKLRAWLADKQQFDRKSRYSEQILVKIGDRLSEAGFKGAAIDVDWCSVAGGKRRIAKYHIPLDERDSLPLHALTTFRVRVNTVSECYQALAILHQMGPHWQGRIKDTLAHPKPNGYSALETTIIFDEKQTGLLRIQTHAMADMAERGIQSRYLSDEPPPIGETFLQSSTGLAARKLLDFLEVTEDKGEFVTVYTPMGEAKRLQGGATALDFAYHIHSRISYHAIAAEVNGVEKPLNYPLQTGDVVQILRDINSRPKEEWRRGNFVKTPRARNWLVRQLNKQPDVRGRRLLENALKRRNLPVAPGELDYYLERLRSSLSYENPQAILLSIGSGSQAAGFFAGQIAQLIREKSAPEGESKAQKHFEPAIPKEYRGQFPESDPLEIRSCKHCNPIYSQDIVGYCRRRKITVHAIGCHHLTRIESDKCCRLIWQETPQSVLPMNLYISAMARTGLVRDISDTINRLECPFKKISAEEPPGGSARVELSLELTRLSTLEVLVSELEKVRGVIEVTADPKTLPPGTTRALSETSRASSTDSQTVSPPITLPPVAVRLPYTPSLPCTENQFIGRELKKLELVDLLVEHHGTVLLTGPLRSGKTSLALNFLSRTRFEPTSTLVLLDCRRRDWGKAEILYQMAYQLFRVLRKKSKAIKSPQLDRFYEEPETAFWEFLTVHEAPIGYRVVFVLDEFESLVSTRQRVEILGESFFAFLGTLGQHNEKTGLLLIGSNRLPSKLQRLGLISEFRGVKNLELQPHLEEDDARRMLIHPLRHQGVDYTVAAADRVLKVTGGWPYYIAILGNAIASQLNRNPSHRIETRIVDEAVNDITTPIQRDTYFGHILDQVTDNQVLLLRKLARYGKSGRSVSRDRLEKVLAQEGGPTEDLAVHLQDLVDCGVIEQRLVRSRPGYRFRVELVGQWLYRSG